MRPLLVFALLFASATSFADTVTFANRNEYESLLRLSIVDDYEDPGYTANLTQSSMNAVVGETAYTATGFVNMYTVYDTGNGNHIYCSGCNGSFRMDFTNTSISDSTGVDAVGFNFFNFNRSLLYSAFIEFGDGSAENYHLPFAPGDFELSGFFGIVTDKKIANIHVGLPFGGATQDGGFGIDNLIIGTVPEPSSFSLCIGSAMLLSMRRQRINQPPTSTLVARKRRGPKSQSQLH